MNYKAIGAFAAGLVVGAGGMFLAVRKHFQKIADKEIEDVKEMYKVKNEKIVQDVKTAREETKEFYKKSLENLNYAMPETDVSPQPMYDDTPEPVSEPFVISPDIFGEEENYDRLSFTYYADGVMTDECDEPLDAGEITKTVGIDAINHFGEYENDAVYIQNDEERAYYEIIRDLTEYGATAHREGFNYDLYDDTEDD